MVVDSLNVNLKFDGRCHLGELVAEANLKRRGLPRVCLVQRLALKQAIRCEWVRIEDSERKWRVWKMDAIEHDGDQIPARGAWCELDGISAIFQVGDPSVRSCRPTDPHEERVAALGKAFALPVSSLKRKPRGNACGAHRVADVANGGGVSDGAVPIWLAGRHRRARQLDLPCLFCFRCCLLCCTLLLLCSCSLRRLSLSSEPKMLRMPRTLRLVHY